MKEHPETNKYELLNSSAERVYDFYHNLNDENVRFYAGVVVDQETESALLSKNEPLITLALAKYCVHKETLAAVFKEAMDRNQIGLRLACLNRKQKISYNDTEMMLPYSLFASTDRRGDDLGGECNQEIIDWLSIAERDEIEALFESEIISDVFLYSFLNQNKYWEAIEKRNDFVDNYLRGIHIPMFALSENAKFLKGEHIFKDYSPKAWELAKKVEPTLDWANSLSRLYENMQKDYLESFDNDIIARWMKEDEGNELGPYATLRIYLYKNRMRYISKYDLSSTDIAYRCAQYLFCPFNYSPFDKSFRSLSPESIFEAYEKDGIIACIYLMRNKTLWQYKATRDALSQVWGKLGNEETRSVYPSLWDCENEFEKSNPEWFKEYDPDKETLTMGRLKDLLEKFKDQTVCETRDEVRDLLAFYKQTRAD
jgi:hypothetical protein